MNLDKAEAQIKTLMTENGLDDWKFKFDKAKKR